MIAITVDSGPLWLQYVVGFGTLGAALFAGWAAWVARSAAAQTRNLVELETARETRAVEEAVWRQARRVSVDLCGEPVTLLDGRSAHDMHLSVLNGGSDPILKCRIKIVVGDGHWGPQLVGTIPPGARLTVTARIITDSDDDNTDGYVRFLDVERRGWVAEARGPVIQDERSVSEWIAAGQEFGKRSLTPEERGTVSGMEPVPNFDAWRHAVAEGDGWPGSDPSHSP